MIFLKIKYIIHFRFFKIKKVENYILEISKLYLNKIFF